MIKTDLSGFVVTSHSDLYEKVRSTSNSSAYRPLDFTSCSHAPSCIMTITPPEPVSILQINHWCCWAFAINHDKMFAIFNHSWPLRWHNQLMICLRGNVHIITSSKYNCNAFSINCYTLTLILMINACIVATHIFKNVYRLPRVAREKATRFDTALKND